MLDVSSPSDVQAIERQLREIAARLEEVAVQTPEMSGMDLAYDRGNVSREDWEAATAAAETSAARRQAELTRIDELRARHPAELAAHVDALLARLAQQLAEAGRRLDGVADATAHRPLRFRHALLPDLIDGLTAWRTGAPSRYGPDWAWRLVYPTLDECTSLLR